ncbi:NAD(P)-dependent oxidoreductase [Streptomyces nodosus]|uniref:Epimerase n=1 Tax=Streptomyces nodosus TaxID=40318 RepID=A0A0B5DKA8_9ACTN|nr:NAD(P)H-binding protein [Streptomyces nodosus]AJE41630.1 epimerase [Streptomyces nodosus]MBB4792836.1 putative NADH-flavin reductase [Streptomyces nodosus]QEV40164.1 NAD-dependent epimerase/dehydratase family protein [Streptomyces nodosus]
MRIVLFGATGMVGSRIAAEARQRGHRVTAVSRSGRSPVPGVTAAAADASDPAATAALATGAHAVVSACAPPRDGSDPEQPFLALNRALAQGVRESGVRRLLVVGGAGSLEAAPGRQLCDQPGFPEKYRAEALAHRTVLEFYRTVDDLDWTYVSPAAEIGPGERTGRFRVDDDRLLTDAHGDSRISAEDFAVACVDELEQDTHPRARMSVAY